MEVFSMVVALLSGVAMFLYGMMLMGDALKLVAGNKLEAFLYKMTNTPLKGVALGAGGDLCDPVLVRDNGDGDRVCELHDDEAETGDRHYHGRQYRDKHHGLDPLPFLHCGERKPYAQHGAGGSGVEDRIK